MYKYVFSKDDFKVHSFQGREAIKLKKIEDIVKMSLLQHMTFEFLMALPNFFFDFLIFFAFIMAPMTKLMQK
jgi:hypothetical protein